MYLIVVATLSTLAYFIPAPNPWTKVITIWILAINCFLYYRNTKNEIKETISSSIFNNYPLIIGIGLVLSSFGDIFLEYESVYGYDDFFIPGLLSFLVAHIFYIVSYYKNILLTINTYEYNYNLSSSSSSSLTTTPTSSLFTNLSLKNKIFSFFSYFKLVCLIISIYLFLILFFLLPKVDTFLIVPVIIYASIISTMVFFSITRFLMNNKFYQYLIDTNKISNTSSSSSNTNNNTNNTNYILYSNLSKICSLFGSLIFMVSDSILAFDKFYAKINNAKLWIMITYYAGQILIGASIYGSLGKTNPQQKKKN